MNVALIMSGGQSRRMRDSLGPDHKALAKVNGVTLLEHNVAALLNLGFRRLYISISSSEDRLRRFLDEQVVPSVESHGGTLECLVETSPLGTIGVAKQVPVEGPLAVVNVDNLTTLNLRAFVEHHLAKRADLTVAVHEHPFRIPFGQVVLDGNGDLTDYLEKPAFPVLISSGTYVLGDGAKEVISDGVRTDITHVFARLREQGRKIAAFRHQAEWIDVNDRGALEQAEQLVKRNLSFYQLDAPSPVDATRGKKVHIA
jgi:NDP-sugar pyrophosphorylase family protein